MEALSTIQQASGADCGGSGTFISDGYNLDSDGRCALTQPGDIPNGAANLGPLQDNGSFPTGSGTGSGQATLTHALLPDSDAIDAGDCSDGTVATDQRGVARPQGAACDIGAYELTGNDPIPESPDREALIALYNSTDGDNWLIFNHDDTNWLIGDHCTWYGVACEEGQVTMLNLRNIRLSGTLPPELGNLVNLTDLTLYDDSLTGFIPPELGNLVKLTSLTLRGGQLTGSIPPELGNLVNLTNLSLGDDELTGSIPPELGNLVNLQSLFLFQNQLRGCLTNQFYVNLLSMVEIEAA